MSRVPIPRVELFSDQPPPNLEALTPRPDTLAWLRAQELDYSALERVYQEAIEIIRLEGPPSKEPGFVPSKYEPTRRYEQYRSPRAL